MPQTKFWRENPSIWAMETFSFELIFLLFYKLFWEVVIIQIIRAFVFHFLFCKGGMKVLMKRY